MKWDAFVSVASSVLLATLILPAPLSAQSVEEFYKQKKQITLIVGSASGTSYDGWARLVARHMGQHVAGNPSILVRNMPGASGITAANHLYNIAPKDGSTFGTFSRNIPGQALMGDGDRIKYDPRLFSWIGSPERPVGVCAVRTDTGVKTAADIMTKEVLMGGSGAGSGPSFMPTVINNVTGSKFKVIEGYQGSSEIHLAIARGEVSGICGGYFTIRRMQGERLKSGAMAVLFSYERKRHAILGDVPSVTEFITDPAKGQLFAFITSSAEFGRPYAAPTRPASGPLGRLASGLRRPGEGYAVPGGGRAARSPLQPDDGRGIAERDNGALRHPERDPRPGDRHDAPRRAFGLTD